MGGWSEEEDENFTVRPSDFTATNFQETEVECSEEGHANQQQPAGIEEDEENHFYKQLGFKVGMIFDGEKRICSGTK